MMESLQAGAGPVLGDRYETAINKVSENVCHRGLERGKNALSEAGRERGDNSGYRN
jgi:hypothetical protein